jgi:hypothetical protein
MRWKGSLVWQASTLCQDSSGAPLVAPAAPSLSSPGVGSALPSVKLQCHVWVAAGTWN